jgi:hypothetical protein
MFPGQFQVVDSFARELDMLSNAIRGFAALSLVLAVSGNPAAAGDVTFQGAPFNSSVGFAMDISPDKKAFTVTFSGLEAIVMQGDLASPIATRVFSFSVPISGTDVGQEIPFFVQGMADLDKGTNAQLLFAVNDQSSMAYLPAESKESFLHEFKYKATDAKEARITVFLLTSRDSRSTANAYLNVSSIDTDVLKHKRQAERR